MVDFTNTMRELINYKDLEKLDFIIEDAFHFMEEHKEDWEMEYESLRGAITVSCLESHKKLIFLAHKLAIAKKDSRIWFRKIKDNPMTLEETSLVNAAYEFLFENKEIYLVASRFFWKVSELSDFKKEFDAYAHKLEGTKSNDIIISASEFAMNLAPENQTC